MFKLTNKKVEQKEDKKSFSLKDFVQPISNLQNQSEQYKVLQELLNADNNLQLKTEINKPFTFAVIETYSKFILDLGFNDSSELINYFTQNYQKYAISKKRQGRKEIVEALKTLAQNQLNQILPQPNLQPPLPTR